MGAGEKGRLGCKGYGRVWEYGRWEGVGAEEMGECGSRGVWRVWEQEKREGVGTGEMGVTTGELR